MTANVSATILPEVRKPRISSLFLIEIMKSPDSRTLSENYTPLNFFPQFSYKTQEDKILH